MEWRELLKDDFESESMKKLTELIAQERIKNEVLPSKENVFRAFKLTPFEIVKVVILGQDPYPNKENATGLAFSVRRDTKLPQSLQNIYKEMVSDLNIVPHQTGDLSYLAEQGVFLLNSVLTVREGESGSHRNIGWEVFTDDVIRKLSNYKKNLVFILWGEWAKGKKTLINGNNGHLIIESSHPSPFSSSKGFFGSKPFSKTNQFLESVGVSPIRWSL